jgi:uncharacterized YkwD family protein
MKIPFKVLATGSLALMLVACNNNNDNAAYDALNPGEGRNDVSVNDNGNGINTRNVGNRTGDNIGNNDNDLFDFTYDYNDRDWFGDNNRDRVGMDNNRGNRNVAFDRNDQRRNTAGELAGGMDNNISADATNISSGKFPHTKPIRIQDAKYGYIVMSPQGGQGQNMALPDLQSITEQYAKRFQSAAPQGQQAQPWGNQQQFTAPNKQRPTAQAPQQQQPAQQQQVEQPTQQQAQQPTQQAPTAQPAPKAPAATPTEQAKTTQPTAGISATEQKVIDLTNAERRKAGLKDLIGDTKLSSVARTKSNDMQKNGYFSHTSPTYGSPFDMMRDFGVTYQTAGENIAQGQRTPEEVVNAWMNSEGHRKNILNGAFTHIGVGHDTTGNHWTQMFIGK